jgi:hypothetical protein
MSSSALARPSECANLRTPSAPLGQELGNGFLDQLLDGELRRFARLGQRAEPRVVERYVDELGNGHRVRT